MHYATARRGQCNNERMVQYPLASFEFETFYFMVFRTISYGSAHQLEQHSCTAGF